MESKVLFLRFSLMRQLFVAGAILCLLGSFHPATAQQTLEDADWFERPLGEGVVWRHYLFDDLYGSKQSISYVDVDLNDPTVSITFPYREAARERISSMIPDQQPDAVTGINGTYFNTSTGGHVTYLRVDGTEIPPAGGLFSSWGYEGALAIDTEEIAEIAQIPDGGWAEDTVHPNILACGPLVLIESIVPSATLTSIGSHCTSRHPRSAIGMTADNHLIIFAADGRSELAAGMTCEEIGETMKALGCVDALNLDGGGSTVLWGKGEPFNGVINFPSDNGVYDHEGERSCSNAVAVIALPPSPKSLDARLLTKSFDSLMETGSKQTVTLVYENNGTTTWTAENTHLILARPTTRTSSFYDESWVSATEPVVMTPATVAPGEQGTFAWDMKSPEVSATAVYDEHFMLVRDGVGRFGPADSAAWMKIVVQPPVPAGESFIVEARQGGQNFGWYSDEGMADTGSTCTAEDCTPSIGSRYGSTYRSVAGYKQAVAAPNFPKSGYYSIYAAWANGSNRRDTITYHVNFPGGQETFQMDQSSVANVWMQLGMDPFYFNEGFSGSAEMTNEDIDVSGSMYASAFKFQYVEFPAPDKSYDVRFVASDEAPTIDGQMLANEWDAASPATGDFVYHNNIANPSSEPGEFRMLYDDQALFILFQMDNQYLQSYTPPAQPVDYASLAGDKVNFFFSPAGVASEPFYRVLLAPNRQDGACYIWSQADLLRTTDAGTGTDWLAGGDAAFSYGNGKLTVEYRIPWTAFDKEGMSAPAAPADGTTWGLQAAITNEVSGAGWEYVNWEPDETPTYVYGNPYGSLNFVRDDTIQVTWKVY